MAPVGIDFINSIEGKVRVGIVGLGCLVIALVAASDFLYTISESVLIWVLIAYIISWCLSTAFMILIFTGYSEKIKWKMPFKAWDYIATILSLVNCTIASLVLAIHTGSRNGARIAACFFGFLWTILYGYEAFLGRDNAPTELKFLWSKKGIIKSAVCISGCLTVALLDAAGFHCWDPSDNCDAARTWAFSAYVISWSVSVIILIVHVTGRAVMISVFVILDFLWSAFSFVHFLLASAVLSCYMKCVSYNHFDCGARLAAVMFGILTAGLYLYEAFVLKADVNWPILKPVPNNHGQNNQAEG